MKPSPEQCRIARMLGLDPNAPHNWPMSDINIMIGIEINKGGQALYLETQKWRSLNWLDKADLGV